jgi:hypothetical protein
LGGVGVVPGGVFTVWLVQGQLCGQHGVHLGPGRERLLDLGSDSLEGAQGRRGYVEDALVGLCTSQPSCQ